MIGMCEISDRTHIFQNFVLRSTIEPMQLVRWIFGIVYRVCVKPILFLFDAEAVHDATVAMGARIGTAAIVPALLRFRHPMLAQTIDGIAFENPVGLAAGFDYDGLLAGVLGNVGFGFHTVGTVTALPYEGNARPRLTRLPRSRSILVNKGFKSSGAHAVRARLDAMNLARETIGISVGSSNVPDIDTPEKAIADYQETFLLFKDRAYVKYFELNISCPNTRLAQPFANPDRFRELAQAVAGLGVRQPIWVKMPSEHGWDDTRKLMESALEYQIHTFIFSNLAHTREGAGLNPQEYARIASLGGGLSGKPAQRYSDDAIARAFRAYGDKVVLVGCGGIFSARDAYRKIRAGARLVQLITGMIYQGPQLIGQINEQLVALARRDGYASLAGAVGSAG